MAKDSGPNPGEVFDVRKVRRLVELMNEYDLSEIDLRQADQRVRLRRGQEPQTAPTFHQLPPPSAPASPAANESPAPSPPQSPTPATDANVKYIRSPIVGTFYASPNPDAAPFIKVGDQVGVDTTVCIVEAMKVFNEVPAEVSGKIVAILAQNGDAVEFGQPLFQLE